MAIYQSELFGRFTYSEDLSYVDLLEREAALIEAFDQLLQNMDGAHIEFTPMGDALRVQCVFATMEEAMCHSVVDAVAPLLGDDMEGRLLFVDKDLNDISVYCLAQSTWKEGTLLLPEARDALKPTPPEPETSTIQGV